MHHPKKTVITLWLSTVILLMLFVFLPAKADRYFLSSRVLFSEQKNIQQQMLQKKSMFQFLRNSNDDQQLIQMLQERALVDRKALMIHFGIIFLAFNVMACFLYIFGMKPVHIIVFVLGFLLIPIVLVAHSYIRIHP